MSPLRSVLREARLERGYALIVTLLLITLLLAGGALMAQELVTRANLLRSETNDLHLQGVVDSAVARMMAKYKESSLFAGVFELEIGGGKAVMEAELVSSTQRRVAIDASYHGLHRRIVIWLYVNPSQPIRLLDWEPVIGAG